MTIRYSFDGDAVSITSKQPDTTPIHLLVSELPAYAKTFVMQAGIRYVLNSSAAVSKNVDGTSVPDSEKMAMITARIAQLLANEIRIQRVAAPSAPTQQEQAVAVLMAAKDSASGKPERTEAEIVRAFRAQPPSVVGQVMALPQYKAALAQLKVAAAAARARALAVPALSEFDATF